MRSRTCFLLLLSMATALLPARTLAQAAAQNLSTTAETPEADAGERAERAVSEFVRTEVARSQPQLRAEISVGAIDSRLRLSACSHTEVFVRPGTRLWGRAYVGYRCLQRPGWSISVPVNVRLFGPAVVALQPVGAQQAIDPAAVQLRELELTSAPAGVVRDPAELTDKVTTRALESGEAIPLSALRALPAVSQGEPVKVVGTGSGFTITTDGIAMTNAAPGELVRVRMESGRTIAGTARRGRLVEVNF